MGRPEWWPWRLVTGNAIESGSVLVVLALLAGWYYGVPPLVLGLAGGACMLLISGILFTRYGLGLVSAGIALMVWVGLLSLPFQVGVPAGLPPGLFGLS
ncbi:MAG: hypothetical protein ACRDI2_20580 [Chloroflexota bacterium]